MNNPTPDPSASRRSDTDWTEADLLEYVGLTSSAIAEIPLCWEDLAKIYDDHAEATPNLAAVSDFTARLIREVNEVHSVRTRIKSPRSLIRKIVRKLQTDPSRDISFQTYQREITDLIGLRALHLFKEDWRAIHDFITTTWSTAETPTAYVREGDNQNWLDAFEEAGCQVQAHPRQYRSIHYLVRSSPTDRSYVLEIQVRTLFEEAWSEIDHLISYPDLPSSETVKVFSSIFNRLAGSADEMGSFVNALSQELKLKEKAASKLISERDEALKQVEVLIRDLEGMDAEKSRLLSALDAAQEKARQADSPFVFQSSGFQLHRGEDGIISFFDETSFPITVQDKCSRCGSNYSKPAGSLQHQCPSCS